MPLHATVTVDLDNGVSSATRAKFNEELKKKHFTKHSLTTLWTAKWLGDATKAGALKYVQNSVDQAAAAAGISAYEVLVSISEEAPTEWKKPGTSANGLLAQALRRYEK